MKSFSFTHELGWSVSRYDTFSACKRKYYYTYYGKFDQEFSLQQITTLKSLTSVPLEIGNIAHDIIETILKRLVKSSEVIDQPRLEAYVEKICLEYIQKKTFIEVYYKEKDSIDDAAIISAVKQWLHNVLQSDRFEWIKNLPQSSKDRWIIEPPGFGETRIEGMKAYCKVDFMLPVDRTIYILDWKTGKEDLLKHRKQLIGYSLFAKYHFENDFDDIQTMVCYIKEGYVEKRPDITMEDVHPFIDTVKKETAEMKSMNLDVLANTPKPKGEFTMTEDISKCRFCEYRELCGR
jgi:hypothetical protein